MRLSSGTVMIKANKPPSGPQKEKAVLRHPMFGCMKGLIEVADGHDLTAPMFEDWELDEMMDRFVDSLAEHVPDLVLPKPPKDVQA